MANNQINVVAGTKVIFADDDHGTEDVILNITSLGDTSGRISARHDLGTSPRPARILVGGEFQAVATPTLGDVLAVYAAWHNEAGDDQGDVGSSDAALTDDGARNLDLLGYAICDTAAADTVFTFGPTILDVKGRYISLGVINDFGSALTSTDTENFLWIYPWALEIE